LRINPSDKEWYPVDTEQFPCGFYTEKQFRSLVASQSVFGSEDYIKMGLARRLTDGITLSLMHHRDRFARAWGDENPGWSRRSFTSRSPFEVYYLETIWEHATKLFMASESATALAVVTRKLPRPLAKRFYDAPRTVYIVEGMPSVHSGEFYYCTTDEQQEMMRSVYGSDAFYLSHRFRGLFLCVKDAMPRVDGGAYTGGADPLALAELSAAYEKQCDISPLYDNVRERIIAEKTVKLDGNGPKHGWDLQADTSLRIADFNQNWMPAIHRIPASPTGETLDYVRHQIYGAMGVSTK
jgi:hypothetical protein